MVAAGGAVLSKGNLWAWCINETGQLDTAGPEQFKLAPALVGGDHMFGG